MTVFFFKFLILAKKALWSSWIAYVFSSKYITQMVLYLNKILIFDIIQKNTEKRQIID